MKKNNVFLLVLCIIYTIVSLTYIVGSQESIAFNIIQFVILYIPFFCFAVFNNKKWTLYMAMFFCVVEGLAGILNCINYVRMFNQLINLGELKEQLIRFLSVALGNILVLVMRIIFICEGIRVLKAEGSFKSKGIVVILLGVLLITFLGYIVSSNAEFLNSLPTIRSLLFSVILYASISLVFGAGEFKIVSTDN